MNIRPSHPTLPHGHRYLIAALAPSAEAAEPSGTEGGGAEGEARCSMEESGGGGGGGAMAGMLMARLGALQTYFDEALPALHA